MADENVVEHRRAPKKGSPAKRKAATKKNPAAKRKTAAKKRVPAKSRGSPNTAPHRPKKVVVIGGGVAGLTAAHELQERGFKVVVYERNMALGGKARSFAVPDTYPNPAIRGLPAEHGFRFFPGFYKHLTDTLSRIPCPQVGDANRHVADNLIDVTRAAYARHSGPFFHFPTDLPNNFRDWVNAIYDMFSHPSLGVPFNEAAFAAFKLVSAMTMCQERRDDELDGQSWWDYMRASSMSPEYRSVIVNGLTQNFVAMDAKNSSAKSVIAIIVRLLNDFMPGGGRIDRILNGPSSEVWIDPWVNYLETRRPGQTPVEFHKGRAVHSLVFNEAESRVTGIKLRRKLPLGKDEGDQEDDSLPGSRGDKTIEIDADLFVAAVPVEAMQRMLHHSPSAMVVHAPSLAKLHLDVLQTNWMSGIMYYLKDDVTLDTGHVVFLDSPWALTAISQNQFWEKKVNSYGNARGILSVIISDFFETSHDKTAQQTDNPKELADETLAQIRDHLHGEQRDKLDNQQIIGVYVDPALGYQHVAKTKGGKDQVRMVGPRPARVFAQNKAMLRALARKASPQRARRKGSDPTPDEFVERNLEPMFINSVNSWDSRPEARTEIGNLFLASDYVKTSTDLASMEGANEAARRAVNALLDHMEEPQTDKTTKVKDIGKNERKLRRCSIFEFDEPAVFAPFRAIDKWMYERGLPQPVIFNTMAGILWKIAPSFSRPQRPEQGS